MGGICVAQRKAGNGRGNSLGDVRSMSGEGVPSKLSMSQSDDDEDGQRLGGEDDGGDEGVAAAASALAITRVSRQSTRAGCCPCLGMFWRWQGAERMGCRSHVRPSEAFPSMKGMTV